MRLRPAQHIRRQGDIRAVRQQGTRVDCGAFSIWWLARNDDPSVRRACFVASTQAVGAAVERNRAKRRMRETFRKHQDLLPAACDLLVVARSSVNRWPFARLEHAFSDACGRMGARRASSAP
jgi:ribonuclease P protein component